MASLLLDGRFFGILSLQARSGEMNVDGHDYYCRHGTDGLRTISNGYSIVMVKEEEKAETTIRCTP